MPSTINYGSFNPQPKPEKSGPKPKKPIAKKSAKRSKEEREYDKKCKEFIENKMICEVKGCRCRSTEVHHKAGRIGADYLDELKWLAVCRAHHSYIEEHPEWAKENNYSLHRL